MAVADDEASIQIYRDILKRNNIYEEISQVQVKTPEFARDQFASQCKLVTVSFKNKAREPMDLFVKVTVIEQEDALAIKEMGLFQREAMFFNLLLVDIREFAESHSGYNGFLETLFPKCYFASEDMIVYENISLAGYYLRNKKEPHDLNIARMVFKNLARLHASTWAYIQHLGQREFEIKYGIICQRRFWGKEGEAWNSPWLQFCIDGAIRVLKEKPTLGSEKVLTFLQKFETGGYSYMTVIYEKGNHCCPDVVTHSDLWNGNVMFKNNPETKVPEQSYIFDLQTVQLGPPALDLQHYAFVALDLKMLHSNWKQLLKIYYDYFKELVDSLGLKVFPFSMEDLEADFKSKSLDGFFFGMYQAFVFDIWDEMEDSRSSAEGDVGTSDSTSAGRAALGRLMESNGHQYSENIVQLFQIYQDVLAGTEA